MVGLALQSPGWAAATPAVTPADTSLKAAYLAALAQSENIGVQKEILAQANEGETQADSAFFPTISGTANFLKQASPSNPTGRAVSPSEQALARITATQPLFRGFRDFALLRQRKSQVESQNFALLTASRQLFYDLSTAYFNVISLQKDDANYHLELALNEKRLKELQVFFKIGRSQLTDVLTLKANIASLEAQLENTKGQLEASREVLAYLTGWPRDVQLNDAEPVRALASSPSGTLAPLESYLAKIDERAEVQQAMSNVKVFEEGVPVARGGHWPSLDLMGNYYLTRPGAALADVNWDVSLALTVPLFQGGIIQSQVRQAQSVARQYALLLSQARRLAEQEIRSFYAVLNADLKQHTKLTEFVDLSKNNFETESKYYRNGLVTNLEVLQATTTYQAAQRQLDRQSQTVKLDTAKLQAASGQRPEISEKNIKNL